jgi:hypothetical protein
MEKDLNSVITNKKQISLRTTLHNVGKGKAISVTGCEGP